MIRDIIGGNLYKREVPYIQQLEAADCGAACLTMVLHYYGLRESLRNVRDTLGTTQFGVTMNMILEGASKYGLRGQALKFSSNNYKDLNRGMILHWEFNHFVVFDKVIKTGIKIIDPGVGYRNIPTDEFIRSFTGLALDLEKTSALSKKTVDERSNALYFKHLSNYKNVVARIIAASIMINILGIVLPALTGIIIDRVIEFKEYDVLIVVGIFALATTIYNALCYYSRSIAFVYLRAKIDIDSSTDFIEHLLNLPYIFFQKRSVGDLMLRMHSNTTIRDILNTTMISSILDSAMVTIYALLVFLISPLLAMVLFVISFLQIIFLFLIRRNMRELVSAEILARSDTNSELVQMLTGIHTLKGVGAETEALRLWSRKFAKEVNAVTNREITRSWVDAVIYIFEILSPFIVLWIGASLVLDGEFSLGTMLALSALSGAYIRPLSQLVKNGITIFELKSHFERIKDVTDTEPEINITSGKEIELKGGISFSNVSFKYEGDKKAALDQINIDIKPGQHVAIVGRSGCGKSTLFNLLLGLHKPTSGQIFFDGHDLHSLSLRKIRRSIGIVPQNPFLFENSVRNNIALTHPESTLEDIIVAARTACIHDEIMAMFNGYDTRLSANGESVSGGQRQRITLARAILVKPKILILDEATSSLDAVTEARIVKNLGSIRCTRIVIAHRLSTIATADAIIMMSNGSIVNIGTHDELVRDCEEYQELLSSQINI